MPPAPAKMMLSRQEIALIAATMLWGASFLIVHIAVRHCGPLFFVGARFVVAGCLLAILFGGTMRGLTLRELRAGIAIGLSICAGYGLQSYGLQTIESAKSAFITALYVPIVPLLQWLVLRRPPRLMSWVGIGLAFAGLMLLADPGPGGIGLGAGEIATLLGTLAIAAEIILIGHFATGTDSRRVTIVQLFTGGLLSLALMPATGEALPGFSWVWVACVAAMAVMSAVIQLTMNWAQKSVSPTRATVIYAGEPVWAGIIGRIAGERLPPLAIAGAALIVLGVIASELRPQLWKRRVDDR